MGSNSSSDWSLGHTLKSRDDHTYVRFHDDETSPDREPRFRLNDMQACSWTTKDKAFGTKELRSRIEPWLTALFQSEHFALLAGSGLTNSLHQMVTGQPASVMNTRKFEDFGDEIDRAIKHSAEVSGRCGGNIEDQIRVVTELLRGLEILAYTKMDYPCAHPKISQLRENLEKTLGDFSNSILKCEARILAEDSDTQNKRSITLWHF